MEYTNELLEAKWKAQRELAQMAKEKGMTYYDFVKQYAEEACKEWGIKPKISKRKPVSLNKEALRKSFDN